MTRWRGDLGDLQNRKRGVLTGWTVYIGTRKSDSMLRIYDKAGEQRRKGHESAGPWVRVELECHQDFADAIARDYFDRGSAAVLEQLNRRIRFTAPTGRDSNPWRAPVAAWWESLLGSVKPGQSLACGEKPECTVDRLEAMAERQCGPALVHWSRQREGELGRVIGILERSKRSVTAKA